MLNWLLSNWQVKLLSLAIAIALWVFVVGQENSEIVLRMPVEITNVPHGMIVVGDMTDVVEAWVRGPRNLVRIAASQRLIKVVDLRGAKVGEHVFRVETEDLKLPSGVQVMRLSPVTIRVQLVPVAARMLPVRPVLPGEPGDGFRMGEVTIKPDKVRAEGLPEDLAALEKWVWTRPIDIHGIKRSIRVKVPVRLVWARERKVAGRVELKPTEVEVVVPIIPLEDGPPVRRHNDTRDTPVGSGP